MRRRNRRPPGLDHPGKGGPRRQGTGKKTRGTTRGPEEGATIKGEARRRGHPHGWNHEEQGPTENESRHRAASRGRRGHKQICPEGVRDIQPRAESSGAGHAGETGSRWRALSDKKA